MEKLHIKRYQYFLGIILFLTGVLLFLLDSNPLQYIGIAFICLAYIYFVLVVYSKFRHTDDEHLRSRIHDEEVKFHLRK